MDHISVYQFTDYRQYIKAYFDERKKNDPKFSHRYLSRRLGLASPNFIMMVMQGKRNLTRTLAFRISGEFRHDPGEAGYFEYMVAFAQASTVSEKNQYFNRMAEFRRRTDVEKIEESQYEYYSNWYNLAIRELVTYADCRGDPKWLAKKVLPRITETKAKHSLELLLKLGLIRKKGNAYTRSSNLISTGPQVSSLAVANFHCTMAQLAAAAMDIVPGEERDMTSCTVNISKKGFDQIKETIAECRKKVMAIAEEDSPAERVYQVNFHLFPVSANNKTKVTRE
jgi:uncharacterized protein (TIGR02147 family)